jgi:O-antigen/teichoic acid export membrane protein
MAQVTTLSEFGQFALMQAVLITAITGFRAIPGTWTLTARYEHEDIRSYPGSGPLSFALIIGVIAAPGLAVCGALAGVRDYWTLLFMGAAAPPILALHAVRLVEYRRLQPPRAFQYSALQLACYLALLVATSLLLESNWVSVMIVYAVGSWLTFGATLYRTPDFPSVSAAREFYATRSGTVGLSLNYASVTARQLGVPLVASVFATLSAVAGLRGAQLIAGIPLQVPEGLQPLFVSRGSHQYRLTGVFPEHLTRTWARIQVATLVPCTTLSAYIPASIGERLLGNTWETAGPALPWIFLSALFAQLAMGDEIYFRVVGQAHRIARVRLFTIAPTLTAVAVGAEEWGSVGAAAGLASGNAVTWFAALVVRRRHAP